MGGRTPLNRSEIVLCGLRTISPQRIPFFKARPGVSYSLRVKHMLQQSRELFVIMDVIDDDPESRWLSVCFYPDMITDPEERGNIIPLGLLGEDGYCFDYDEWDEEFLRYLETRLDEAHKRASQEAAGR